MQNACVFGQQFRTTLSNRTIFWLHAVNHSVLNEITPFRQTSQSPFPLEHACNKTEFTQVVNNLLKSNTYVDQQTTELP